MSEDTTRQLPDDPLRQILARFDSLEMRMRALEDKVERRLQDTRPLWEEVLTQLTAVEERLTKVEERLGKLEEEVFWLGRNFRNWTRELSKLQEKYEDLEERFKEFKAERSK
jgi:chromosome segregation ATPase